MNACFTTGLMQQSHRLLGVLVLSIFSYQMAAYAAPSDSSKKSLRIVGPISVADAGRKLALSRPNAIPSDLPANSGKKTVHFNVSLVGKFKPTATVYLRRSGDKQIIAMNDVGKDGDVTAKDGTYGVNVQIDTDKEKPDTCVRYETFIKHREAELKSAPVQLCVSGFPVSLAISNVARPAEFPDGSKAVADEILLTVMPTTTAAAIRELANSIHANIVGSYMTLNLYQLKLPKQLNANQLLEIASQLKAHPGVVSASINAIGSYAYAPDDTAFNLPPSDINSQHGLKLALAHNPATDANAWDGNNRGAGRTVVVMDTGLDLTHPDLGPTDPGAPAWTCQSGTCSDTDGHGTQVTGVIAAKTHNTQGVAGVAFKSKIHSIQVSTSSSSVTTGQMITGFTAARDYLNTPHPEATVVNASFFAAGGSGTAAQWATVCGLVEQVVFDGLNARAVVVNAVGNVNMNAATYPAACKNSMGHPELLIAVSASISIDYSSTVPLTSDPLCLPLDNPGSSLNQRCRSSSYGAWVDIAAPGSMIRTTSIGNTYPSSTGNSFSAPLVAGAAAILNSCGMSPDLIKSTLTSSASVNVQYPAYGAYPTGTTPLLDINRALHFYTPTASNTSAAETYFEDTPLNLTNIVVTDLNGCASVTATLQLSDSTAGSLSTATSGSVTSTFVGGLWTASGPVADVNTLLAGVTFNSSLDYNSTFNITTSVSDGYAPAITGTKVMTGSAVNDAPVNTVPVAQTATEDIDKVISGISVFDADAGASAINMTLTATHGTISVNTAAPGGVSAANITGNNTANISLTGSQSQINATLANATGVTYHPATNFSGPATLTVLTNDNGASGGPAQSDNDEINIDVAPVNDPPETAAGSGSGTEDVSPIAVLLSGSDIDGTVASFNIVSGPSHGTLYSDAAMTSSIGVGGSVAAAGNTATVYFKLASNFNGPDSFTYASVDNLGLADSSPATAAITVAPANDLPSGSLIIVPITPNVDPPLGGYRHSGDVIGADASGINDIECPGGFGSGVTCNFSYQWAHVPPDVPPTGTGATSAQYHIDDNDKVHFMGVCVSYVDTGGSNEQVCNNNDAFMVGDPHITTVDGLHFDFQGAGEFVALRGANGMEIQLRMAAVPTAPPFPDSYTGLTSGVSVNTAVAARVGKRRVTYQPDTSPNAVVGTFVLRVDGVPTTLPADGYDLGDGGRVISQPSGIQIDFPDQTTLLVNTNSWPFYGAYWLHISVFHTSATKGIMGSRSKGSWLPKLANGSALGSMPSSLHDRYVGEYETFANSWRVNKETTLFDYDKGTSTETFTNKAWPTENGPYAPANAPVAKPLGLKAAQLACRDIVGKNEKADCVFDVRVIGHADLAKGHVLNQKMRAGLTAIFVRDDRDYSGNKEIVTFTATVARHAAITRMALAGKDEKFVPTGIVQFTLNGKKVGEPVKLNARGQAQLKLPRSKIEKQTIGARYIPVKGSVFLPSSSFESARMMVEGKR